MLFRIRLFLSGKYYLNKNNAMKINQFYKIFNVIIYLVVMNFFFLQGVYAEDISNRTKVVKYSGRSITERHPYTNFYTYSVADLNEKIAEIKKTKIAF